MSSVVNSKAVFKAACEAVGLTEVQRAALEKLGWDTYGTFAFCVSAPPGQDIDRFASTVQVPVLGSASHVDAAKLNRLHFESFTFNTAELKRKLETDQEGAPKPLPAVELAQRIETLQAAIDPFRIVGKMEPSHALVNLVGQMVDTGRLRFIPWHSYTTRDQEVLAVKEIASLKGFKTDANGFMKEEARDAPLSIQMSSELDVLQALRRRGVAYALGQLMSFPVHEQLIAALFQELQRDPQPGFLPVTLGQIMAADREIHLRLAEQSRGGFPLPAPNVLPLDKVVVPILSSPSVMWLLMPTRKHSVAAHSGEPLPKKPRVEPDAGKQQKLEAPPGLLALHDGAPDEPTKKKKKTKKASPALPKGLHGGVAKDKAGKAICFGYNLGTCAAQGSECGKGRHVCCAKGCFSASHTFLRHS